MIWQTLALFVVSFIGAVLFAPKPQFEDARKEDLDSASFPRSTEDAPIPLILGLIYFEGPNTIYSANFRAERRTKKVKTGLFSKKRVTTAWKYYLTFQLAACLGPRVQLRGLYVDDQKIFAAEHSQRPDIEGFVVNIEEWDLFGGPNSGGGFGGLLEYYPGDFNQIASEYLEGISGVGEIPACRGVANLVFQDYYLGEQPTIKKIALLLGNYPRALDEVTDPRIGEDINPASAIYFIMRNGWAGLDLQEAEVDKATFQSAATTLYAEANGVSISVSSQRTGKDVIAEILRQIDGVLFEDRQTGKIKLKLIRADFGTPIDVEEDDIIDVTNFSRSTWAEVISEVKVSFSKRNSESGAVALAQDGAVINMLGKKNSSSITFPLCYDADTANKLAARELSRLSQPIFRMTIEVKRSLYDVEPGDVLSVTYPRYGLNGLLVRVQKLDAGALDENRIVLECIQEQFASDAPVFSAPTPSAWVKQVTEVSTIIEEVMLETPFFYDQKLETPSTSGFTNVFLLPRKPTTSSTGFELQIGAVTGELDFVDPEEAGYSTSFKLTADMSSMEGFENGLIASLEVDSLSTNETIVDFTEADNRSGELGIFYCDGEYFACEDVTNNMDGTYTLGNVKRGLFGSQIAAHSENDTIYFIDVEQLGEGDIGSTLESDGTVYWKSLDKSTTLTRDPDLETQKSQALTQEIDRPVRPRYLAIEGDRTDVETNGGIVEVTWRESNKASVEVTFEDDATQVPNEAITYRLEVWIDGSEEVALRDLAATTPYDLDLTGITGDIGEVRVYSNNGLQSSAYAWLQFAVNAQFMRTSGDEQSGTDRMLLSGDQQDTGNDKLRVSGT